MADKKELPVGNLTIMFTDIVGSTDMADFLRSQRGMGIGDDIYIRNVLQPHGRIIRQCLEKYHGYEVKTLGDSFMVVFEQPNDAVIASSNIIKELELSKIPNPADPDNPLQIRIGLHSGIIYPDKDGGQVKDYAGHDVNLAARVEGLAVGSQVLLSGTVKEQVSTHLDFEFHRWGKRKLKGIKEHVEIYELLWEGKTPGPKPPDEKSFKYPSMFDLTTVIGRGRFINDLKKTIATHKLLTVCGIGGVGKTATVIEACRKLDEEYDIFFVAMDRLNDKADESQIIELIVKSTELPKESGKNMEELISAIGNKCIKKPVLLIIDKYESLDKTKGRYVIKELSGVPNLKILVTSRIPVGIHRIEKEIELNPFNALNSGNRKNAELVEFLKASDSYRLLESRVRLLKSKSNWQVSDADAEDVKSIIEATCGIPLAIELVASRMNSYSWREAVDTLKESFELMNIQKERYADLPLPESHLSMKACFNWSYEQLSEPAQSLFRALSLFANGYETLLVENCYRKLFHNSEGITIRDLLGEIQISSLIRIDDDKWSFLPIVHRYAKDLLSEDGNKPVIEDAFIAYWSNFVEVHSGTNENLLKYIKLFKQEYGHLVETLNLLLANKGYHGKFIDLTNNLSRFWLIEKMWGTGIKYLNHAVVIGREKALKHPGAYMPDVALVCTNLAGMLSKKGEMDDAKKIYEEALKAYKTLSDKDPNKYMPYVARTANNLAALLSDMGDIDGAKQIYEEALKIYRALSEKDPESYMPDVARANSNLANTYSGVGDTGSAKRFYEEALKIYRALSIKDPDTYMPHVARASGNLAAQHSGLGDIDNAKGLYEEAITIYNTLVEKYPDVYMPDIAMARNNLADIYSIKGDVESVMVIYEETLKVRQNISGKNTAAYMPHVATTCNNLAMLLAKKGDMERAKYLYEEALKEYKVLSEKDPAAYIPLVATTCRSIASLLSDMGDNKKATQLLVELLNEESPLKKKLKD